MTTRTQTVRPYVPPYAAPYASHYVAPHLRTVPTTVQGAALTALLTGVFTFMVFAAAYAFARHDGNGVFASCDRMAAASAAQVVAGDGAGTATARRARERAFQACLDGTAQQAIAVAG